MFALLLGTRTTGAGENQFHTPALHANARSPSRSNKWPLSQGPLLLKASYEGKKRKAHLSEAQQW